MKVAGAIMNGSSCVFRVWAPLKENMRLHILEPHDRLIEMKSVEEGYFEVEVRNLHAGTLYCFVPDESGDCPDPASCFQPNGVHGPSQIVAHDSFEWTDDGWQVPPMQELIFYETHVGTFTKEGTFDAIIARLGDLAATGINALELMPVNQFPGNRNWGYDGVFPYAVQNSYGGVDALKRLVDACHAKGIAVFLDVIYNHIGPEGNCLRRYGPYFTKTYSTPWGEAVNFDDAWSDGVRDYFAANVLYWFEKFHIDGLRCDAVHMVYDNGAVHFWEYVHRHVQQLQQQTGRTYYLVAESDLNSPKVVTAPGYGGYGFDAQWLDDFHHALYTVLDKKGKGRYEDYGELTQLAKGYTDGFVLSGEWTKYRNKKYGRSSAGIPGNRFVVFNQNHDQIGNRVKGERLSVLVDNERLKMAAAAIMLAPYVPMLFMGEEYGERAPFYYFISHADPALIKAVRQGRKEEFANFGFEQEPPDPQDEQTFDDCKLRWEQRDQGRHKLLLQWHRHLITMRRTLPALQNFDKHGVTADVFADTLLMLRRKSADDRQQLVCIFNFSDKEVVCPLSDEDGRWKKLLDSRSNEWTVNGISQFRLPEELDGRTLDVPPVTVAVYEKLNTGHL